MHKILNTVLLVIFLSSCSTFRETHYFKDDLKPTANYYRVEVKGSTLMSSSRYVSGYYDRGAVQLYFGEINQPPKGKFPVPSTNGESSKSSDPSSDRKEKELVLLLSTNSDAIASSISNLVKSKTVINSLTMLTNKDKLERSNQLEVEISETETDIELFIAKVDAYLDVDTSSGLNDKEVKDRLKQLILMHLPNGSRDKSPNTFSDLYEIFNLNFK